MTRLQTELLDAIQKVGPNGLPIEYVLKTELIAKRYIEKAFGAGEDYGASKNKHDHAPTKEEWLTENGIE